MYIGNQPVLQTSEFREEFTATAGQTVFNTLGFAYSTDSAFVEIFRNGVLLGTEDYTLGTDGTTVTLSDACSLNDIVLIKGRRAITQGISITESRTEYTWQSGDTYVQLNADIVPGYADVYLNGVKLHSAEFSIDTGTKRVTFTTTPSIGDEVSVVYRTETSSLVALPLKDSAGNTILSESGGEVSLSLSGDLDVTGELTLGTALAVAEGGTGVTSLGSLDAADLGSGSATDGYVLTADGAGNAAWEAASGGGGGTTAYLEHSSTISDSFTVTSGTNRMYIGGTTFSGTINVAGRLVIVGGEANFTGTINTTGVLAILGVP